ncbi:MAG: NADH-quinone oxidoreductase subunit C [Gaiella sp.]
MTGDGYRAMIEEGLAGGWRFAGLHASENGSSVRVVLVARDGGLRLETCETESGRLPTIVDLAPAAGWDEREAADTHGVGFEGHEPMRPLVDHDVALSRWTVPISGRDPYQVAVGPIHAGVIESGHFRFHVVGEKILHLDARLFYKHRGLERAAEGHTLEEGLAYASRACAACAVTNGVAYAQACEHVLGLRATPQLARARTILLELERVWSHLNDISAICAGTGLAAGSNRFAGLSEQARRLNHALAGHRYLFGAVQLAGSSVDLDANQVAAARLELDTLRGETVGAWRELVFNRSFQDRLPDIGIVDAVTARQLGTVGPSARAAGVHDDARTGAAELSYPDFASVSPQRAVGDVQSRLEQRLLELEQSFATLETLLDGPVRPAPAEPGEREAAIGLARVESPRGATLCVVERDHDRLARLRLRTGSYANWPSVAHAAAGNMLPDFPLINKSFELCYACADR